LSLPFHVDKKTLPEVDNGERLDLADGCSDGAFCRLASYRLDLRYRPAVLALFEPPLRYVAGDEGIGAAPGEIVAAFNLCGAYNAQYLSAVILEPQLLHRCVVAGDRFHRLSKLIVDVFGSHYSSLIVEFRIAFYQS
jgi:hypothetical protein